MKKTILFSFLILLLLFAACKKTESNEPTSPTETENYFPNSENSFYKYSYSRVDSSGQSSGTRTTTYKGTATIKGTVYKIQIDSLIVNAQLETDTSYFRTTSSGVYYFIDTTGFASSITDSSLIPLIPYVTIDNELLGYLLPLSSGKTWPVFKITLTSPILVTVVDVSALVEGTEPISLNLASGLTSKEAVKVKFILTLRLNPLSALVQTYTANVWLVKDIGPAKWSGCGTLVNVFTGIGINFADTTTVVDQSLIDYSIK